MGCRHFEFLLTQFFIFYISTLFLKFWKFCQILPQHKEKLMGLFPAYWGWIKHYGFNVLQEIE